MNVRARNEFKERLKRLDDSEVMQMRDPVQAMVRSQGWKLIEHLVAQRVGEMRLMMETGLHQHAEYTAFVGELRGMQTVEAAIDAVLASSEEAAERAAQTAALEDRYGSQ